MVPRRRGACRLQGEGDLSSALKNPYRLEGDPAQPQEQEMRVGGRQPGGGVWWEMGGTPCTQMPLRASAAYQALYQTRMRYFYYFLNIFLQ